ncbi:MAG: four helix bundle protein [Pyrinomonadaceae bacterium]|nr:four helix bundle protein [Pyrinomonadaceae bacterium]
MARIERFEDIEAWKLAREVTRAVYSVSSSGVFAKDFALVNQVRRATVSILSNIAEGFERNGDKEFVQFLSVAKGSCGEARAQLYVALDQGYLSEADFLALREKLIQVSKMISGLIAYLRRSDLKGSKFR